MLFNGRLIIVNVDGDQFGRKNSETLPMSIKQERLRQATSRATPFICAFICFIEPIIFIDTYSGSTISSWLWGKLVQEKLDDILYENQIHRIRKQRGILLPSGARRIDLYTKGEQYGYRIKNRLIEVDKETVGELLQKYDKPELLMFGTPENVVLCGNIYNAIGCPSLHPRIGWKIFIAMVNYYLEKVSNDSQIL